MPSFCIFQCSVDRFIPRRAAAPFGPPEHPAGFLEHRENMLTLGIDQRHRQGVLRRLRRRLLWLGLQIAEGDL